MSNVDIFNWRSLTEAVNKIQPPESFLLDTIFSKKEQHLGENLDVEIIVGNKKLAPFVSPIEGGTVIAKLGRRLDTIKFPRIRMKKPLNASELTSARDLSSQNLYIPGGQSILEYRRKKIGLELQDLVSMSRRRTEWLAAQALSGVVTVEQDNLSFSINFGIPNDNKPTLEGNYKWGGTSANIVKNLRDWKRLISNGSGFPADTCILGTTAAEYFLNDTAVMKALNNFNYKVGALSIDNSRLLGNFMGITFYEYSQQYVNDAGDVSELFPAKACVLTSSKAPNKQHNGAIIDLKANANVAAEYFSKTWEEEDPSSMWLLLESRPLVVPHYPEAIVYATIG